MAGQRGAKATLDENMHSKNGRVCSVTGTRKKGACFCPLTVGNRTQAADSARSGVNVNNDFIGYPIFQSFAPS